MQVSQLATHSWEKTLALLLRYVEAVPPEAVVAQLDAAAAKESSGAANGTAAGAGGDGGAPARVSEGRLFEYLHALFLQDVHLGAAFHGRQVRCLRLASDLPPTCLQLASNLPPS